MVQSLQTTRSATTQKLFSLKTFASYFNSDSATSIDSRAWAWNGTDCQVAGRNHHHENPNHEDEVRPANSRAG
jgi:hypothetical protein